MKLWLKKVWELKTVAALCSQVRWTRAFGGIVDQVSGKIVNIVSMCVSKIERDNSVLSSDWKANPERNGATVDSVSTVDQSHF